jgi:hypothetical protein
LHLLKDEEMENTYPVQQPGIEEDASQVAVMAARDEAHRHHEKG